MKSILVVVVFSFFCLKAMSSGNDHGNGGGVICVNKKCQTLIEAGLQISSEYPDFWIPSENVLKNINTLINKYPFSGNHRVQLRQRVLLNLTHFKIVEVVDPVKLDKIKKLYIDTIKASAPGWDPTNFKIVALSSDDTTADQNTFLLPDFLDLDEKVQSQLLIHEGLYRGRPTSDLKYILQLESALARFTMNFLSWKDLAKHAISAQIAAFHLNILNKPETLAHIMISTYLSRESAEYFSFSITDQQDVLSFFEIKSETVIIDHKHIEKYYLVVNRDNVQENAHIDARTTVMLLNLNSPIPLEPHNKSGHNGHLRFFGLDDKFGFFVTYYTDSLKFAEPEKLNLLLPR